MSKTIFLKFRAFSTIPPQTGKFKIGAIKKSLFSMNIDEISKKCEKMSNEGVTDKREWGEIAFHTQGMTDSMSLHNVLIFLKSFAKANMADSAGCFKDIILRDISCNKITSRNFEKIAKCYNLLIRLEQDSLDLHEAVFFLALKSNKIILNILDNKTSVSFQSLVEIFYAISYSCLGSVVSYIRNGCVKDLNIPQIEPVIRQIYYCLVSRWEESYLSLSSTDTTILFRGVTALKIIQDISFDNDSVNRLVSTDYTYDDSVNRLISTDYTNDDSVNRLILNPIVTKKNIEQLSEIFYRQIKLLTMWESSILMECLAAVDGPHRGKLINEICDHTKPLLSIATCEELVRLATSLASVDIRHDEYLKALHDQSLKLINTMSSDQTTTIRDALVHLDVAVSKDFKQLVRTRLTHMENQ
eukprot:GHVL01023471.1.p1 GENE.GHVL01023471.1~~GHVL01023471.1.p1  ORF type:complete len:414 (+),score=62.79 GHVL01023471.1:47-1288(+)